MHKTRYEFSEAEVKLFTAFNAQKLLEDLPPLTCYNCVTITAFGDNTQGPHVEALRRAVVHLNNGGSRSGEEFDKLVAF